MEISDVHVKMIRNSSDRLKAVCTITFDGEFVVRDVKVVEGTNGMFVAMPSRKLSVHCKSCNQKNHLRSKYCNECGTKIDSKPLPSDNDGRTRLHRDIAHPITPAFRERVQEHVIKAYEIEHESIKESQEIEEVIEEVIEEPQVVAEETQEENEDDYESTTSKRKGSGFEEYDEIIASLKGSQQSRTEEKSEVIARDSEDESHEQDEPSEPTASRFQDDDEVVVKEEEEQKEETKPSTAAAYDQSSESENQATAVNNDDDDCAFGEGIL